jgi:hypothetical protein
MKKNTNPLEEKYCLLCGAAINAPMFTNASYATKRRTFCSYRHLLIKKAKACGKSTMYNDDGSIKSRPCTICGKFFQLSKGNQTICPKHKKRKTKRFVFACVQCGKKFTTKYSHQKFCSPECNMAHHQIKVAEDKGGKSAYQKDSQNKKISTCPVCNKRHIVHMAAKNKADDETCSRECRQPLYYKNNQEAVKAYRTAYVEKNRAKINEKAKQKYYQDIEKSREKAKKQREKMKMCPNMKPTIR